MGWIDSPGAWSLLFNHNPAAAQTGRENAPAPTTAPQTSRGDTCGESHACVYPAAIPRWLCRGVSSYPLKQRPGLSHWVKRTGQRPAHFSGLWSNSKKPERRTHPWHRFLKKLEAWSFGPPAKAPCNHQRDLSWLHHVSRISHSAPGQSWNLYTKVSRSLHYWYLGLDNPLGGRACLCTMGCWPTSLAFTH